MLNASIESLVGFLEDDPIACREIGLSKNVRESKEKSKELVKGNLKDTEYAHYVGKDEPRLALRRDIYTGKYDDADIEEITETPFERFLLAKLGIFDADQITMKFQGKIYTINELSDYLKSMDYTLSGSGAVYKKSVGENGELGLIPSYLEYLFKARKSVKKEMLFHFKNKMILTKFKMAAESDGLLK